MGSYFIPNATLISEAAAHINEVPPIRRMWGQVPGGIWFSDPRLTDAECAALYADYTPTVGTEDFYTPPRPPAVESAVQTLLGFYEQNPATVTAAQSATLLRAVTTILRWFNREIEHA
jgi:hypothetical protein